jgi:indole-3-glycerol phosphate synthase
MMLHIINMKTITTPITMNTLCIFLLLLALSPGTNAFPTSSTTTRLPFAVRVPSSSSAPSSPETTALSSSRGRPEDLYAAVHRKEYEMKQCRAQHVSTTDPVRMAMSYAQESVSPMRLARALRRVYEDPQNPANPNHVPPTDDKQKRTKQLADLGMADLGMRRGAFIVDIKRQSLITHPGEVFCRFDSASMVAEAMVRLGADVVLVNTDFAAYGGDMTELKAAVRAVRAVSDSAAVVMKDIVVDEIQLGLAKEAGADGIYLMSSVLGPALETFLDLATSIGLETIVECHTKNEVERALSILAPTIVVNNYDRIQQTIHPEQAIQLAGMFPGSGGPIICLATGGIEDTEQMKRHLAVGYDGVVVGKAVMGSPMAPEFIRAVRDRTLLPAEFSQWGLENVEFDMDGNVMTGPKKNVPSIDDEDVYQ